MEIRAHHVREYFYLEIDRLIAQSLEDLLLDTMNTA